LPILYRYKDVLSSTVTSAVSSSLFPVKLLLNYGT